VLQEKSVYGNEDLLNLKMKKYLNWIKIYYLKIINLNKNSNTPKKLPGNEKRILEINFKLNNF
jgi:hypothetical protein